MREVFQERIELGRGVFLRGATLDDIPSFLLFNVGSVRESFFPFNSYEEIKEWLKNSFTLVERGEKLELVIFSREHSFIGSLGVNSLGTVPDIGIWIREELQGNGFGRLAVQGISRLLLQDHKIPFLTYKVERGNMASIGLARSLGLLLEGEGKMTSFRIDRDVLNLWE